MGFLVSFVKNDETRPSISCQIIARAEGPSVARLINLSGRAGPSGAKPREFEGKIYLYISELIFKKVATEIEHILRLSKLKEYASH